MLLSNVKLDRKKNFFKGTLDKTWFEWLLTM